MPPASPPARGPLLRATDDVSAAHHGPRDRRHAAPCQPSQQLGSSWRSPTPRGASGTARHRTAATMPPRWRCSRETSPAGSRSRVGTTQPPPGHPRAPAAAPVRYAARRVGNGRQRGGAGVVGLCAPSGGRVPANAARCSGRCPQCAALRQHQPRHDGSAPPDGFAANAAQAVAEGFRCVKLAPFDEVVYGAPPAERRRLAEGGLARVAAVRAAVGEDIPRAGGLPLALRRRQRAGRRGISPACTWAGWKTRCRTKRPG